MVERFGADALSAICLLNFTTGLSLTGVGMILPYYFKEDMGLQPADAQLWMSIIVIGWALKPLWGTCTDAVPLYRHKIKSYVVLSCILATTGLLIMAALPPGPIVSLMGLMGLSCGTAWSDVVVNAYCVKVAKRCIRPSAAADISALQIAIYSLAGALGIIMCTALYTVASTRIAILVAALIQAMQLVAVGWIEEEPMVQNTCSLDTSAIRGVWAAMRPGGASEGVLMWCMLYSLASAIVVPDNSQALFAYSVSCVGEVVPTALPPAHCRLTVSEFAGVQRQSGVDCNRPR
jgi:hypothetical protein